MPQPEQPHTILLVHCHYRLPGGEDAVFAAECAMLQAHGHRVITYERSNDAGGLAQKLLLPLRAIYSTKTVREVRALIRKEQVDLVHVHNTLLTISPSVFQACFKEHVPAVQTLHNFRIFCPNGILMRDGHVCEECPQHGLGCAVRHSCYRGSRAQSLVCAGIYAFHRLLGTYRKVNLITLTEFDRSKLLEFNRKASRPVFTPERLYCKPNGVAAPNHSPLPWAQRKNQIVFAGRLEELKGLRTAIEAWQLLGPDAPQLIVAGTGPLEAWAKENARSSGLGDAPIRYIVDDCAKFVRREINRGHRYDAIIMDPPSYGRGPSGEIWRFEDNIYDFVKLCSGVLSDDPLFMIISSYTAGVSPSVPEYILGRTVVPRFGGRTQSGELGLPAAATGLVLPCGHTSRWIGE